jgi:hypothetical protein
MSAVETYRGHKIIIEPRDGGHVVLIQPPGVDRQILVSTSARPGSLWVARTAAMAVIDECM